MKSSTMTVRSRLMLAFGILIALLLLVAGLAWRALQHESDAFEGFVSGINARAAVASELRTAVDTRAIAARNLVLVTQPRDMELERGRVTQAHETATRQLARLQDMARAPDVSAKARELIAAIARVESQYGPVALAIVQLALQQQHEEAIRRMNEECRPLLAALVQATQAYAAYTAQRSDEVVAQSDARVERERNTFVLVVVLALASGLGSGVLIVRSLTRALGAEPADLSESASRVATGDLRPLEGGGRAPAGSVLASLVAMQGNLVGIVRQVRDVSDSIATGSAQIATGNAHLSQRTEEQASALEQTAATMDQLGTTVRYNADHAQSASQLAQEANGVATRGGAVMDDVIATMKDIEASSRRIVDIIGTIEGIAFQTNILALNAAVESARAGEQGRGFAVVAGEVRTLAQRSAVAAKEIKILIDTSVAQVQRGASLVDHAGGTMQEVAGAIQRVSTIVDEISVACRQQSTGVGQVGEAVSQMDQATQQNAALVEQSAAAAESLRTQAQRLVSAVGVFSLDAGAAT